MPAGWDVPAAQKPQLDKPDVTATAEGNMVYVSWTTVDGAKDYTVSVNGEVKKTAENTETTYTFEGNYSTTYTITVVANPTDSEGYNASTGTAAPVTTGADPNAGSGEEEGKVVTLTYFTDNGTSYIFKGDDGHNYLLALRSFNPGIYDLSDNTQVNTTGCTWTANNTTYFGGTAFAEGDTLEIIKNGSGWSATYTFIIRAIVDGDKVVATCANTNLQ